MDNDGVTEFNSNLLFDLRQIYAQHIVGQHLLDIMEARKKDNYLIYHKCMKDLFIVVRHKIKKDYTSIFSNKKIDPLEEYNYLLKVATVVANKYPFVWLGKDKNPQACQEIEFALNNIEMFLYHVINKANLFGGEGRIQGL